MADIISADLCVIGAGSGGLTVAAVASQLGLKTVLIERARMGGDCLNFGCVPSKALIAAATAAEAVRRAPAFGVNAGAPQTDFARVRAHVRDVIASIAPQDSAERFEGLGVRVIAAEARFIARDAVRAGDTTVKARRFVIATGSSPAIPPIPGLKDARYLTNETIFDLAERPEHLIVIGGGPIGCEIAQAYRRLGARVTIIEAARTLANEDPELAAIVTNQLRKDGVAILESAKVEGVASNLTVQTSHGPIGGSHLLVATGRHANIGALDLEKAGIAHTPRGIAVNRALRSSNPRVYAVGDAAGGLQFTHLAAHHAGIVIRNALFRMPARADAAPVPRVTYTAPELAQVGLTEQQARETYRDIRILRWPFAENDRARAERDTAGFVKLIANPQGRLLGAGIVGPHAGELIQSWILPTARGMKLKDLASLILPYPTLGEAGKRAATTFYAPQLFAPRTKRLVRFLTRLPILG